MKRKGSGSVSALKFRLRQLLKPKAQMRKPDVVSAQTNTLFRGEQAEWRAAIHPAYDALRPKYNSWGTTAKFRLKCRSASCCASVRDMWKWVQRFPEWVGTRQVGALSMPGCCLGRVKAHRYPAAQRQWKLEKCVDFMSCDKLLLTLPSDNLYLFHRCQLLVSLSQLL